MMFVTSIRSILVAAFVLILPFSLTTAVLTVDSPTVTKLEQGLFDAWENFLVDYDSTKKLFAPNVQVTACFSPHPCETFTGFDAAFAGFSQVLTEFDLVQIPLVSTDKVALWQFAIHTATAGGCKSMISGIAIATFDDNDLVATYQHFSENTDGMFACIAKEDKKSEL